MTNEHEYDFEELKKRTIEALNSKESGLGLLIREAHYFIVDSVDGENNRTNLGKYPICLVDEYKKFVDNNMPNRENEKNKCSTKQNT